MAELIAVSERYRIGKTGFSIDVSDHHAMVPDDFLVGSRKFKIWEWEAQFWQAPLSLTRDGDQIYRANIDTTFALYNKKYFDPVSYLNGVRVAGRYTCRHLPWYRDSRLPPEEEDYYRKTAKFSFFAADTAPKFDTADIAAVGLTPSNDGFARIPGASGTGLFVIAATNVGSSSQLTARLRPSHSSMPLTATICETDPATGQCKGPPASTVMRAMDTGESTTWSAFLQATGVIAQDAARNRVIFEFVDKNGVVRSAASAAVTTE